MDQFAELVVNTSILLIENTLSTWDLQVGWFSVVSWILTKFLIMLIRNLSWNELCSSTMVDCRFFVLNGTSVEEEVIDVLISAIRTNVVKHGALIPW